MASTNTLADGTVITVPDAVEQWERPVVGGVPEHAARHGTAGGDEVTPGAIGAAEVADLADLAGAGRTTETVKNNADAIALHITDNSHKFARQFMFMGG